jgi:hypothetical protein
LEAFPDMTPVDVDRMDHYVPAGYAASLTYELYAGAGRATDRQIIERTRETVLALLPAFDAIAGQQHFEQPFPQLDDVWRPSQFALSMAQRIAGPLWPRYTPDQRFRACRFAAGYVAAQLRAQFLAEGREAISRDVHTGLPPQVRGYLVQLSTAHADLARRRAMVAAYLAVHPDGEVVPAELREIVALEEVPFF